MRISLTLLLIILTIAASSLRPETIQAHAGEPPGDSVMLINCIGILPSTPSCVDETLQPFETIVYDGNGDGVFNSGDTAIVGPAPPTGTVLTDDPKIMYRDASNNMIWNGLEPIFYDTDGTVPGRIYLYGTPTTLTTLVLDDPHLMFADTNGNGVPNGIVKVTVRLENLGGTYPNGTREDVDAIQAVYTYNPSVLRVMRRSYPDGTVLPEGSYTSTVRNHCTAHGNGVPFDTIVPDEFAGQISSSDLCATSLVDVGLGCNPAVITLCPGDPSSPGSPLQNVNALNIQFMILSHGYFTLAQVVDQPGIPGSYIVDLDGPSYTQTLPLTLVDGTFDNRKSTLNQPPTASFSYSPLKPTVGQPVLFDASDSIDPDGTITGYFWSFGDGAGGAGLNVYHTYSLDGARIVTLTVTDNGGLSNSTMRTIQVNPGVIHHPPVVIITYIPRAPLVGDTVTFNGTQTYSPDPGVSVQFYQWYFGDGGSNSSGPIVTHSYSRPGTYTVRLDVTDSIGLFSSNLTAVFVTRIPYLPGVRAGDWAKYIVSGNSPGFSDLLVGTLNITSVSGFNITVTITALYFNGTTMSQTQTIDIRSFNTFFTAANLTVGDLVYMNFPGLINQTITGTFVGTTREANKLEYSQFGSSVSLLWDRASGILLHLNSTYTFAGARQTAQVDMVETNIWTATLNRLPVPLFGWTPTRPSAAQPVSFDASRSYDPDTGDTIVQYRWDFGDGHTDTTSTATISHTYASGGNYTVTLTVVDNHGDSLSSNKPISIARPPAHDVAIVQVITSTGIVTQGQNVTITVTVSNPGSFAENVTVTVKSGNRTLANSQTTRNLAAGSTTTIQFIWSTRGLQAGFYIITANATQVPGETNLSNNILQDGSVTVLLPLTVTLVANPTAGIPSVRITFTAIVRGGSPPYSFSLDFGDQSPVSTLANTTHVYPLTGTFTVRFTVRDFRSSANATLTIRIAPLKASLTASPTSGATPVDITFTASASGGTPGPSPMPPYTYSWRFGDGASATTTTGTAYHTYSTGGTFTANVTVTDSLSNKVLSNSVTITVTLTTGGVKITVEDSQGNPVVGATVRLTLGPEGQTLPAAKTTGSDGSVTFTDLLPGDYTYEVAATGFQTATLPVRVSAAAQPIDSIIGLKTAEKTSLLSDYRLYAAIGPIIVIALGIFLYRRRQSSRSQQTV